MANSRKSLLVIVLAGSLLSCQSFNHYTIIGATNGEFGDAAKRSATKALEEAGLSDEAIRTSAEGSPGGDTDQPVPHKSTVPAAVCPVYQLPKLDPEPALPYDQLERLAKGDEAGFDAVMRKHNEALYAYIHQMKEMLRASHAKYLQDCQNYLNSGH
jgi:hypothetical protein